MTILRLCSMLIVGASVVACAPDADVDYDSCESHEECVLTYDGCCFISGEIVAVRADAHDRYHGDRCGEGWSGAFCPGAIALCSDIDTHLPTCRAGHCTAVRLDEFELRRCENDADCVLRSQACCEPQPTFPTCVPFLGTVSVQRDRAAEVDALLCDAGHECPEAYGEQGRCVERRCER